MTLLVESVALEKLACYVEHRTAIVRELDRMTGLWLEAPEPRPALEVLAVLELEDAQADELRTAEAVELTPAKGAPLLLELLPVGEGTGLPAYPDGPYRCGLCEPWPGPCAWCRQEWRGFLEERAQEADWRSLHGR